MKRLVMLATSAATLALTRIALADPAPESGYSFPRDVSVDGWRIDELIQVTMVFVVLLFVIMCIWLLGAVFKFGPKHKAQYDHGSAKKQVVFACTLSAVIFFVVDGNLFYKSMRDLDEAFWNFEKAEAHPEAVRIQINGHQWAWDVRYAGPDKQWNTKDDIVLLNDIRVPYGVPVIFQIASVDVLHSLYLPNMRIKTDAVPGTITHAWFQAQDDVTGEFDVACAQHCGIHHYKMEGRIHVMSPDDYATWHAQASAVSAARYDEEDAEAHWGWDWEANRR